jgi:hypothetical protein
MRRDASLIGLIVLGNLLATSGGAQPPRCVAVTEIMFDPDAVSDTNGEWFEITNFSLTATYDLEGWSCSDSAGAQSFVIDHPLLIGPRSFVLLARSGDTGANGGIEPDHVYGSAMPLSNGGDSIVIRMPGGEPVDMVRYAGGVSPPGAALACEVGNDVLNDQPGRWYPATTPYGAGDLGTPGQPNEIYAAGYCAVDVGIEEPVITPDRPDPPGRLLPARPNPGSPPILLRYELGATSLVRLSIHDAAGRTVRVVEHSMRSAGRHAAIWNGDNAHGAGVAHGVYWIRLETGNVVTSLPITLHR